MNKFFRWPMLVILATLLLAAMIPAFTYFHGAKPTAAHAASGNTSPSISLSASVLHPNQTLSVTGQGFAPGDIVSILLNYYSMGTIPCDSNGNCAGTVKVPEYGETQGEQTIIGDGTSGLSAQTTVTIVPGIFVNTKVGGPGTTTDINGTGFVPSETLKVYWGKVSNSNFIGITSVDSQGNLNSGFSFQVTVPIGIAPGTYVIIVARSHQTPASVFTRFNVLAPKIVSSAGIRTDQPAHVKLSGFQASELVNLSWNANSGQNIATLSTDATGTVDTYIAVPFAPKGSYTLTAKGNSSGLTASSSLNIGPGILLTLNTASPGSTIIVSGGGFISGETVNVFFQNKNNGVTIAIVDPSGSFSVHLTIPIHHSPTTSYFVYAVNTVSKDNAKAQFFYMAPSLNQGLYVYYNNPFTISGQGFNVNETITLTWQYASEPQPVTLGTAQAASDGTFATRVIAPAAPYAQIITITAIGSVSKVPAISMAWEINTFVATPLSGPVSTTVQVTGSGYGSTESVIATLQGTQVATFTTDVNGLFTGTFAVPSSVSQGNNTLQIYGSLSGASASVTFLVTPLLTITPTTGPSGTIITVNGSSFPASSLIQINWEDPGTGLQSYLALVNTTSTGIFTTTVTAPANLSSGHTYYVTTVSPVALATFVAQ